MCPVPELQVSVHDLFTLGGNITHHVQDALFANRPEILVVENQSMDTARQEHLEAGVSLRNTEERRRQNRETQRARTRLLDVPFHPLVDTVEVLVIVENRKCLFLEVLVAEPNRRDKTGRLARAVCLPQGETAFEESLRETLVDTRKFRLVVRNQERKLTRDTALQRKVRAVACTVEHNLVAVLHELFELFAELFRLGFRSRAECRNHRDTDGSAHRFRNLSDLDGRLLEVVYAKTVVTKDELLLLLESRFGRLDISDIFILFHKLLLFLGVDWDIFIELLRDEKVVEEKQHDTANREF